MALYKDPGLARWVRLARGKSWYEDKTLRQRYFESPSLRVPRGEFNCSLERLQVHRRPDHPWAPKHAFPMRRDGLHQEDVHPTNTYLYTNKR